MSPVGAAPGKMTGTGEVSFPPGVELLAQHADGCFEVLIHGEHNPIEAESHIEGSHGWDDD